MTTAMTTAKSTGLTKISRTMRDVDARIMRARESFTAKVTRAEADYFDAVKRAVASMETPTEDTAAESISAEPNN